MNMKLADYKGLVKNELWLYSTDAIKYRGADKIVDIVCSKKLIQNEDVVSLFSLYGNVQFMFSGCPLLRLPHGQSTNELNYLAPSPTNYKSMSVVKVGK